MAFKKSLGITSVTSSLYRNIFIILFHIEQIFCLQKIGMSVLVPEYEALRIMVLTWGRLKCVLRGSL